MTSIYRGSGANAAGRARTVPRTNSRKKRLSTRALVRLILLVIVTALGCTLLIISSARNVEADKRLSRTLNYQDSLVNRINGTQFEIQRELLPDNLFNNARLRLGMIEPSEQPAMREIASIVR